jgi:hypothetical protein|tara:strand:- start:599 stop:991 length:393 start_codon:yes stop_codon:yes gene_type:complete
VYSKEFIQGAFLSHGNPEVSVVRNGTEIGYRVRIRICLRGSEDFLLGMQRSLLQHEIDSKYKAEEHSARRKPILIVSKLSEVMKLINMLPLNLPSNADWDTLAKTTFMVMQKEHLTQDGLDKILKMKGVL